MLTRMYQVEKICIHCSESPNGRPDNAEDIHRWHTAKPPIGRGWRVAGYHFVNPVSGEIEELVRIDADQFIDPWEIANGARGHNHNTIHICMVGTDKFTGAQWNALHWLLAKLIEQFPGAIICGHNELNPGKTCPGFDVQEWLAAPAAVEAAHLYKA